MGTQTKIAQKIREDSNHTLDKIAAQNQNVIRNMTQKDFDEIITTYSK